AQPRIRIDIDITQIRLAPTLTDRFDDQLGLCRRLSLAALAEADNRFRGLQMLQHDFNDFFDARAEVHARLRSDEPAVIRLLRDAAKAARITRVRHGNRTLPAIQERVGSSQTFISQGTVREMLV